MKQSRFHEIDLLPDESVDDFMDGRLKLIQSKAGYRFSIDAILLSEFVTIKEGDTVVDLGTGCGIIPLVLLLTRPVRYAVCLEIQEYLAHQSSRNAMINGFSGNMGVIRADIRQPPLRHGSADAVVCNPPYRKKESGRINPDQQRAIARHEIRASLEDILDAARHILRGKGRLAMIYPVERLVDLMSRMRQHNLEPKRMRIIYPEMGSEAKLAMIEATLGGRSGLKILPPLLEQGDYSIRYQA
jgi:tRNA1Val (adenine37-N6)-methyltransferase